MAEYFVYLPGREQPINVEAEKHIRLSSDGQWGYELRDANDELVLYAPVVVAVTRESREAPDALLQQAKKPVHAR